MGRFVAVPASAVRLLSRLPGQRNRVRPFLLRSTSIVVGAVSVTVGFCAGALLLGTVGCGGGNTPTDAPGDPAGVGASIGSIALVDEVGDVGIVTPQVAADPILVFRDDPTRFAFRALNSADEPLSEEEMDGLDFVPRDVIEEYLSVSMDTADGGQAIRCVGHSLALVSFRVEVCDEDQVVFRSAPIPIQVEAPLPQSQVVQYPDGRPFATNDAVQLELGEDPGPLRLRFLDAEGTPINSDRLGRLASVEYATSTESVIEVSPDGDDSFGFRAVAHSLGQTDVIARLVHRRTGRLLGEFPLFQAQVVPVATPPQWHGFQDGPNGKVERLVGTADGLVVQGQFTSVGGMDADGLALWTPDGWREMPDVPGGVESFAYDGDKLIAVTGTAEVVEWTGSDWINIRVLPQVEPVVLFRGAPISLSDVEATWLAPEGPRWRLIDLAVVENRLFAISTRTMSYPGGSPIDGALQELVGDAWHTVAVIGGDFQGRWDGMIGFVQGCGESVYFSGGTPNEQDDTWDLIRTSGQQMACLDGSPYVIFEYYGGLYQLVDGVHVPLGSVAHPSQILAVATYEGNVFIGGEFSEVDGIPSQNLASYSP